MLRLRALAFALLLAVSATIAPAAGWPDLVERYAPAIVNLKITLKTESETGGEPEESTEEAVGAIVDPSGLILVWNSHFSPGRFFDLIAEMGGGDFRMKVTPTEIKVYIDGDPKEHRAFFAAADSDLDLAFVQLEEPPEQPLPTVEFGPDPVLEAGTEVAAVSRLTGTFDRVPYVDVVRLGGRISKPRSAWILSGGNATQMGLPYFAPDGRPAGVLVTVISRAKTDALANPGGLMLDLLSLGRGSVEVGPLGIFLLPSERVSAVVEQAKVRVRELLEERREGETEGGAEPAERP
jgi:hypothetical protein